jgi:hypothetical protein
MRHESVDDFAAGRRLFVCPCDAHGNVEGRVV